MSDAVNPLVPAGYDMAWTAGSVLLIVLLVVALVSMARSAAHLTATNALIWTLVVIVVPVVGPVAWLVIGRRSVPSRTPVVSNE